ncbi:MAG: glutathione binding-like protein [Polyangiaceae bacterium]
MQWLFFLMTDLEAPLDVFALHVKDLPADQRIAAITPWARTRFHHAAEVIEKRLATAPYLGGDKLSIADIVLASMMSWASRHKLIDAYPKIRAHKDQMLARPTARKLFAEYPPS